MKTIAKNASGIFFCGLCLVILTSAAAGQNMFRKVNDFDGDGKADFAVTRNVGDYKYWYILQSTNGFTVIPWGLATDENAAGDYDGDGKYDPAIFRQSHVSGIGTYAFWVLGSQYGGRTFEMQTNSYPNVVGIQQDYDGDGKTDVAYSYGNNGSQCFIWFSSGTTTSCSSPEGYVVKLGDTDGDNKADLAGYNLTNNITSIKSSVNNTTMFVIIGTREDQYGIAADFDGDGKGDVVSFRPTTGSWQWLRSSDNVRVATTFGTSGDVPVPADYDGDGKTDLAVYRPGAQSYFWVYGSQVGVYVVPWGVSTDTVVRY